MMLTISHAARARYFLAASSFFLLFGALSVQLYVYTLCFPQDRRGVKVLVYGIYVTMIVCLCLDAADLHFWFAAGFDPVKFQRARFSGVNGPIVGSLVGLCTQLFFAYRISMFRQAVWLSGVVVVISLMQAAGGIGVGSSLYIADSGKPEVLHHNVYFLYMWLIGSAVSDALIAAAMTYLLMNTAEPGTHHVVKRIVRLILETNSLTASVAIAAAILHSVSHTTYFLCPTMILPEFYANTLLLVLNNRASPDRTAPQRVVPSSNNIGCGAPEDVQMKIISPPPRTRRSPDRGPSFDKARSLSPRRTNVGLTFQAANRINHPRAI
ncbi:hypothetical protein C8J57DRAFT_1591712 [Mycena rebaudengoi]|nr:hypothetical protein C8J57DRAFT_1591712 [Mycena rebaudengoi]